jgi:hypothetical protein
MKPTEIRTKLSRQIIIYNFALIVIVIILFMAKGFDPEDFTTLMGLLTPITAVYTGTLFKYFGHRISKASDKENKTEELPYGRFLTFIVPGHFIIILSLISARGMFNIISFNDMILIFTFIETSFGAYVGYIISALFETKEK